MILTIHAFNRTRIPGPIPFCFFMFFLFGYPLIPTIQAFDRSPIPHARHHCHSPLLFGEVGVSMFEKQVEGSNSTNSICALARFDMRIVNSRIAAI
jgi:hypothetical protein